MSTRVSAGDSENFSPVTAGLHQAVCYGIIDIGTQKSFSPEYPARSKIVILWELPNERIELEKNGVHKNLPRGINNIYTASLHENANMRTDLEGWRGRPFTPEELEGFELRKVLGTNCMLNVVHKTRGDKTYANIMSVTPLAKGMDKRGLENKQLHFDLDVALAAGCNGEGHINWPENMPEWIRKKIRESAEYMTKDGGGSQNNEPPPPNDQDATFGDDDIPF